MFVSRGWVDVSICAYCFTSTISVFMANTAVRFSVVVSFKIHCAHEHISFA